MLISPCVMGTDVRAVTNNQIIDQYKDLRPIIGGKIKISIIEICL